MAGTAQRPHSANYFGASREFWWNADFIALMASRWQLGSVHRALDVGCGVGHWGRTLGPHLHPSAKMFGVDREQEWVDRATEEAARAGVSDRHRYQQADLAHLPFADGSFDLVTCQTVLIHVPDVRAVLAEMARVTAPGGLIAVAEPNNMAGSLVFDRVTFEAPVDETLDCVRLQMVCERGKAALGEGNNSIGGQLPGMFADMGLTQVSAFLSDKSGLTLPPYGSAEARAIVDELLDHASRDYWHLWERDEAHRYFLAGGGDEGTFEALWQRARGRLERGAEEARAGRYRSAGGHVFYLVSGRRPVR